MEKEYTVDSFIIVDIEPYESIPNDNDMRKVVVELDGRKLAIYTTESNINAFKFDQQQKKKAR